MPVITTGNSSVRTLNLPGAIRDDRCVHVGLVNNMPDSALDGTERQFLNLLNSAAPDRLVVVTYYSLPGVPRGEAGKRHLIGKCYGTVTELSRAGLDGLIVTGTEPKQLDLRCEPYWDSMSSLFEWIDREGPSTIFSCLAGHAAVLHFDGIERRRLTQKCFGLFDHTANPRHALTNGFVSNSKIAHSRWNEVKPGALEECGYKILTSAPRAGVDLFMKRKRNLLLFFQGHPEYEPVTLCREYQRDIRRFLAHEQETYPNIPESYFDMEEAERLARFRARAIVDRDLAIMDEFPVKTARLAGAQKSNTSATSIVRTWLLQIAGATNARRVSAYSREDSRRWVHQL
jgi:homoserine O-succinyltransferase